MTFSRQNPSPRYQELAKLYQTVHEEGFGSQNLAASETFSGGSLSPHLKTVRRLVKDTGATSLLDYGAGKGSQYRVSPITVGGEQAASVQAYWGLDKLVCYDPGYAPFATLPTEQFDGVICTDVLEHIPDTDLPWILAEQFNYGRKFVFGNIASFPADKTLPNGENAHCTIQPLEWWAELITRVHRETGSSADYFYIVETKVRKKRWFGLKTKIKPHFAAITNRSDWQSIAL